MLRFAPVLTALISTTSFAGVETTILNCTNKDLIPGAPAYRLSYIPSATGQIEGSLYSITKYVSGRPVGSQTIAATRVTLIERPELVVFSANLGRSGYAHFYAGATGTLLDINIFDPGHSDRAVNTDGAQTDFVCKGRQ